MGGLGSDLEAEGGWAPKLYNNQYNRESKNDRSKDNEKIKSLEQTTTLMSN